jgi:glyoxylase-like metal-dependent hydrolase (beta-lactamase superfamily II)
LNPEVSITFARLRTAEMRPILLPAGNASAWTGPTGNNTYLLPGRIPTLIDAGVGNPEHVEAIARELGGHSLALVLLTHGHVDHVSGVPALRARWPDVRIRQFGIGDEPLTPDERIAAGDSALTVVYTPGHAPDHCCFQEGDEIFCGDLARIGGTVVIPASKGGDLKQYLESLRRIRALAPRRLLPGHGPIVDDPSGLIDQYLEHRAARERQVIEAIQNGFVTTDRIVARIYEGLPAELLPAAVESVLAHLIKLEADGMVRRAGDRWLRVRV